MGPGISVFKKSFPGKLDVQPGLRTTDVVYTAHTGNSSIHYQETGGGPRVKTPELGRGLDLYGGKVETSDSIGADTHHGCASEILTCHFCVLLPY